MTDDQIEFEQGMSNKHESTHISETLNSKAYSGEKESDLVGIKGWLILVALGRIITPISVVFALVSYLIPSIVDGSLNQLSEPGSEMYSAMWKPVVYMEFWGNIIYLTLGIALLVLFFGKKKAFPKWFIITAAYTIVFAVADAVGLQAIQNSISYDLQLTSIQDILNPLLTAAIWVPYMLKSQRVKNTFVN